MARILWKTDEKSARFIADFEQTPPSSPITVILKYDYGIYFNRRERKKKKNFQYIFPLLIKSNDINQYKSCTLPSTDKAIVSFFLPRGKNGTKNPPSLRLTRSSSMAKYLKVGDIRSAKRNETKRARGGHTVTFQLDNYISIEKNTGRTRITPSGEIIVRAGCHTQYCVHSYSCLMLSCFAISRRCIDDVQGTQVYEKIDN